MSMHAPNGSLNFALVRCTFSRDDNSNLGVESRAHALEQEEVSRSMRERESIPRRKVRPAPRTGILVLLGMKKSAYRGLGDVRHAGEDTAAKSA